MPNSSASDSAVVPKRANASAASASTVNYSKSIALHDSGSKLFYHDVTGEVKTGRYGDANVCKLCEKPSVLGLEARVYVFPIFGSS